jgi:hypothetical protein
VTGYSYCCGKFILLLIIPVFSSVYYINERTRHPPSGHEPPCSHVLRQLPLLRLLLLRCFDNACHASISHNRLANRHNAMPHAPSGHHLTDNKYLQLKGLTNRYCTQHASKMARSLARTVGP